MAQRPASAKRVAAAHPAADAYGSLLSLGGDVARLLRRAMAETDDTKAIATINSLETVRIKERAEQLQPSLSRWVNTLSAEQKEEFLEKFERESPLAQCLDSLEHNPATKARIAHNPRLQNTIHALVYYTL